MPRKRRTSKLRRLTYTGGNLDSDQLAAMIGWRQLNEAFATGAEARLAWKNHREEPLAEVGRCMRPRAFWILERGMTERVPCWHPEHAAEILKQEIWTDEAERAEYKKIAHEHAEYLSRWELDFGIEKRAPGTTHPCVGRASFL